MTETMLTKLSAPGKAFRSWLCFRWMTPRIHKPRIHKPRIHKQRRNTSAAVNTRSLGGVTGMLAATAPPGHQP
jgi:hypothetical protein